MTSFVVQGHLIILMQYGHALIGYFSLFMALKNIKLLQRSDFVLSLSFLNVHCITSSQCSVGLIAKYLLFT